MSKSFKLSLLFIFAAIINPVCTFADEGMWLPFLIGEQRYHEMKKLGLRLSREELYDINESCIKDGVLGIMSEGSNLKSYGTGSFISDNGLVLTNHHIILSYLERFSNADNDFIKYGYWATKLEEESYCRGLEIKQLVRMEDVTEQILDGCDGLSGSELKNKIDDNGHALAEEATKGTDLQVRMQALWGNNQYIMNVYRVFKDVRMVTAPPATIGYFGGDIDNYKWPRHSGDFAILRIYANKDNKPARYNKDNIPYKPAFYFPLAKKGVKQGDFVMTLGFPGLTRKYIPSFAIDKIINGERLDGMKIRKEKISIIEDAIAQNDDLKFRYTAKLSNISNVYLRWKGEYSGVMRSNLLEQKRAEEAQFTKWANQTPERKAEYGDILERMESLYDTVSVYNLASMYLLEAGITGAEVVPFIGKFEKLAAIYRRSRFNAKAADREAERLVGLTHQFFENWDYEVDRKVFRQLVYMYYTNVNPSFRPDAMIKYIKEYNGDIEKLTQELFANSIFTSKQRTLNFLEQPAADRELEKVITNDPLYQMAIGFYQVNVTKVMRQRAELQSRQIALFGYYMKGFLEMTEGGKALAPDANGSLRYEYGIVDKAAIEDGLTFEANTTLSGAIQKFLANPEIEEYYVPKKVQKLYAEGHNPNVCFLNNSHTSSGNSGSPVINGKGELVGLNFDRVWQGIASDYRYDPQSSRAIALDVEYILFMLEYYTNNHYVLDQLTIK